MTVRTRLPYPNDVDDRQVPHAGKGGGAGARLLAQARALPGVEHAAVGSSSAIPLDHAQRDVNTMPFLVEGRGVEAAQAPVVTGSVVSPTIQAAPHDARPRPRLHRRRRREGDRRGRDQRGDGAHVLVERESHRYAREAVAVGDGAVDDRRRHRRGRADGDARGAGVPQIYASAYQKPAKHLAIFLRGRMDTAATAERFAASCRRSIPRCRSSARRH